MKELYYINLNVYYIGGYMNNKYKNIFIAIIMIIISIIALILALLKIVDNTDDNISTIQGDKGQEIDYSSSEIKTVTEKIDYFTVNNLINNYLKLLNVNNSIYYIGNEYDKTIQQNYIYNLLSYKYMEENNITKDNILEKVTNFKTELIYVPLNLKVLEKENINKYIAYGIVGNMNDEFVDELYIIVNLDKKNKTYSIEPINMKYNNIEEIKFSNEDILIEKNSDNSYKDQKITNEYLINEYLSLYKKLALIKPEIAYSLLNEEYREARFGSLEKFKEYINDNRGEISKIRLEEYLVNNYNNYIEYVAKNQFGNYYIFNEYENNRIELKLDEYTILTDKFKTTYAKVSDENKVKMNIDKFFKMINNYDYSHVYACLSKGFRDNYFYKVEDLEKYLKNNLFTYNSIEYKSCTKKGSNLYVYDIEVVNMQNNSERKSMSIIMKLNDDYNFEVAFNM